MSGMGLTRRQGRALAFIRRHFALAGYAPSISEIIAALGLRSKKGGADILRALEECGHIRRIPYRARAIEPARPAAVQYFAMQRIDGEARLVPLDQVRVGRDDGAGTSLLDSPGASASGGFSDEGAPETKQADGSLRSGGGPAEYTHGGEA